MREYKERIRKEDIVRRWNLIKRGIYHKNIQVEAKITGTYRTEEKEGRAKDNGRRKTSRRKLNMMKR